MGKLEFKKIKGTKPVSFNERLEFEALKKALIKKGVISQPEINNEK